jgi:hypothetical protein
MPLYSYRWPDNTLSLVQARDVNDAYTILDEIGEADVARITKVKQRDFFLTLAPPPDLAARDAQDEEDDDARGYLDGWTLADSGECFVEWLADIYATPAPADFAERLLDLSLADLKTTLKQQATATHEYYAGLIEDPAKRAASDAAHRDRLAQIDAMTEADRAHGDAETRAALATPDPAPESI